MRNGENFKVASAVDYELHEIAHEVPYAGQWQMVDGPNQAFAHCRVNGEDCRWLIAS